MISSSTVLIDSNTDSLESFRVFCVRHGIPLHAFDLILDQPRLTLSLFSRGYESLRMADTATCLHALLYLAREELKVNRVCVYDGNELLWDIPERLLETEHAKKKLKRILQLKSNRLD